MRRALRHAEQRAHAELGHRLDVEHLDLDADLAQFGGAAGEFDRKQHIRRLVDQFARHQNAVDNVAVGRECLARSADIGDSDRQIGSQRGVLAIFLLGLVAIESIGAQARTGSDRGRLPRLHRSIRQIRHDGDGIGTGAQLAGDDAAELEEIILLDGRRLAGADHDQPRGFQPLRRQDIQR